MVLLHCSLNSTVFQYIYITLNIYIFLFLFYTTLICLSMLGRSLIMQSTQKKNTSSAKYHLLSLMEITRGGAGNRLQQLWGGLRNHNKWKACTTRFRLNIISGSSTFVLWLHAQPCSLSCTIHFLICRKPVIWSLCVLNPHESQQFISVRFCFVNIVTQLLQGSLEYLIQIYQSQNSEVKYSE